MALAATMVFASPNHSVVFVHIACAALYLGVVFVVFEQNHSEGIPAFQSRLALQKINGCGSLCRKVGMNGRIHFKVVNLNVQCASISGAEGF